MAEDLEKAGAGLLIHNEKEDICIRVNGKTAYEYLLDACGGKVGAEVDTGWMYCGGVDPEEFLWAHADLVKAVHYKDMKFTGKEAPFGKGMVDLKASFQFARANGALQIVDMDATTLEDICRAGRMLSGWTGDRDSTDSILCTLDVETGEETVLHGFPGIIEAPNWLNDGNTLLYNSEGKIYRYEIDKDHVEQVDTGDCVQCNNDHVPSPDNKLLAVSCMPPELKDGVYESHIYVLPMGKGTAKDLTGPGCSFLHGWSPDGKELAYCAFRQNPDEEKMRIEICTIPCGWRRRNLSDGRQRLQRRSGVFAGRKTYLVQQHQERSDAGMADEPRRQRPHPDDRFQCQQLVRARFAGWKTRYLPDIHQRRAGAEGASSEHARIAWNDGL